MLCMTKRIETKIKTHTQKKVNIKRNDRNNKIFIKLIVTE